MKSKRVRKTLMKKNYVKDDKIKKGSCKKYRAPQNKNKKRKEKLSHPIVRIFPIRKLT